MGTRRKARECALQMLFAADIAGTPGKDLTRDYWNDLSDTESDQSIIDFSNNLVLGTLKEIEKIDEMIRSRAEHWRIPRMAVVDRNVLRLAVYEFMFESTPHTVIINEALEIARRFSTFEATQFINGILDAIKQDIEDPDPNAAKKPPEEKGKTKTSSI